MPINHEAPVPIYYQIKQEILERIEDGRLQPGDRIESEERLAKRYDISRMTARHAVTHLVNDGYLYRVHGKGTFVCKPRVEKSVAVLTGFAEDMQRKGFRTRSSVLSLDRNVPDEDVRESLNLKPGEEVYRLVRVRYANDIPMSYQKSFLPVTMFPGLDEHDFEFASLYGVLAEQYDIEPVHATQRMEARTVQDPIASLLETDPGSAVFFVERISYGDGNRPMEVAFSWHRGDKYVFEMKLYSES